MSFFLEIPWDADVDGVVVPMGSYVAAVEYSDSSSCRTRISAASAGASGEVISAIPSLSRTGRHNIREASVETIETSDGRDLIVVFRTPIHDPSGDVSAIALFSLSRTD